MLSDFTFRFKKIGDSKAIIIYSSQPPVTAFENQTQALSNNTNPGHIKDVPDSFNIPTESKTEESQESFLLDINPDLHEPYSAKKPPQFLASDRYTTIKPTFHYITKAPKSTHQISSTNKSMKNIELPTSPSPDVEVQSSIKLKIIVPTTYSPPKYLLKSILPSAPLFSSSLFSFRPKNQSRVANNPQNKNSYQYKTLKAVRKLINPITVNHELAIKSGTTYESAEDIVDNIEDIPEAASQFINDKNSKIKFLGVQLSSNHSAQEFTSTPYPSTTVHTYTTTTKRYSREKTVADNPKNRLYALLSKEKQKDRARENYSSEKHIRITVEVPPPQDIIDEDTPKPEPDQQPSYKLKPILTPKTETKTDSPVNTSLPTRVSRVNAAIKSLIAIAGTKGPSKCSDKGPKCKVDAKQRYLSFVLIPQINLHGTAQIFLTFALLLNQYITLTRFQ